MTVHLTEAEAAKLPGLKGMRVLAERGAIEPRGVRSELKMQRKNRASAAEVFDAQLRQLQDLTFEREHKFALAIARRWRFDFAIPAYRLAIEIEGLVVRRLGTHHVVSGRHCTIGGFIEDSRKYANAAILGWTVLRFPQALVRNREAIALTRDCLMARGWTP